MNFLHHRHSKQSLIVIAFVVTFILASTGLVALVSPTERSIGIATGSPQGMYNQVGDQLRTEVARSGVNLINRSTGGALDNLELLNTDNSGIDFAIIQGGIANSSEYPDLVSVIGRFYEPVWVWYREDAFKDNGGKLTALKQLRGKRVSIGNEGSGTNVLSKYLLYLSGVSIDDIIIQELKVEEAQVKLSTNELDVVFLVTAVESPIINKFVATPGAQLMNFNQADAYTQHLPYLSRVVVPRGTLSIRYDQPKQDTQILADTATLVAHKDVIPELVTLMLTVSREVMKSYSKLQGPATVRPNLDFPLHVDADEDRNKGSISLYRIFPFWKIVTIDRYTMITLPLFVFLVSLFGSIPLVRRWLEEVEDEDSN